MNSSSINLCQMTTRSKGKLKIWLFDECVVNDITGAEPPTSKLCTCIFDTYTLNCKKNSLEHLLCVTLLKLQLKM